MYAVIQTGGKQYRVREGERLRVERLPAEPGEEVSFDRVLLVADGDEVRIGAPVVEGARVTATVQAHGRGPKIRIIKLKRRKHHMKRMGHRQDYTEVRITGIQV